MRYRSGKEIRELFIKFWVGKGSYHYPSFSLIPEDPSLLFTIAGMVPFKAYYLGIRTPEYPHAVTSQKCVRTNDIENVGRTARHHTFFEMLGNFAWGSYFKKEAISWAWEFLTQVIGLDPDKMYASIYENDEEAWTAWHDLVGLPETRIRRFGQDENYWFMGEGGPCGPCSEIYYDRGEGYGCGSPSCDVGCDCDRFLEIWNLVFTQYDRQKNGDLIPLPRNNIDTGMGLERLTSVVQGVDTDYETDLFMPLIEHTCAKAGIRYGENAKNDMAARVIADHARSVAFMLADGVLPANDGPGYVLRRLLRRGARYGRLLGFESGFLGEYLPILIDIMGDPYRELIENNLTIKKIIDVEENRFEKTLMQGTDLFDSEATRLKSGGGKTLPGDVAFTLYDTYGFPIELTLEMAEEQGISVDREGFDKAMEAQRQRARVKSKQKKSALVGDIYTDLENELPPTVFTGYTERQGEGKILAILTEKGRVDSAEAGEECELVLDVTPFYAERGGEVGDVGRIHSQAAPGSQGLLEVSQGLMEVIDAVPRGNLILHRVKILAGSVSVGIKTHCEVDDHRRSAIRRNHTATHLLHEALGRVLGGHVRQAGSLVTEQLLRFDFTHHGPLTHEEIEAVERIVNEQTLANIALDVAECNREEARKRGAKALFDEKYGDIVRVVAVPGFSTELCGGLHVRATGDIGLFKVLREESIGSGTRRIFAVTGMNALELLQRASRSITRLGEILSADETNLPDKAEVLVGEVRQLRRQLEEARLKELANNAKSAFEQKEIRGVLLQMGKFPQAAPDMLRDVGDKAKSLHSPTVVVMASVTGDDCRLVVMADDAAVRKGADAGALAKEAALLLSGRGGGRPNMAQGGGKSIENLDRALAKIATMLEGQVKDS
ncbi:MAG: alanine--tRNA ligase [Synergistaceae bacterium]|jgi:alanyl-tRNA synthetase|nr:alanine--tRNA ligase [Synergistaceae bacterium]